jgi:hypothetical protein
VAARGPGEQHAQREVRQREVQQEDPQVAGDDRGEGLHGEHDQRDRHEARNGAGSELADDRGEPDRAEHGPQARVAAGERCRDDVTGGWQPEGFRDVPADRAQQPLRPWQLKAFKRGGVAIDCRGVGALVEFWGKPWQGEQLLRSCGLWL